MRPFFRNQQGLALITVLLIASIVSAMALWMTSRQQIDIRRTANIIESERAFWLAKGVESWGVLVLMRDNQQGGPDNLGEDWALELTPTGVEGAIVAGELEDLQARINLNNLLSPTTLKGATWNQLSRLFEMCEIDAVHLYKLLDWLDEDLEARDYGAEDDVYLGMTVPYRAANRRMVSPSELRLVAAIEEKGYQCLEPNITVLPKDTFININTAPAEVIAVLADDLSLAAAREVVADRPLNGFLSIADFLEHPSLADLDLQGKFLTDRSEYFLATSRAKAGRQQVTMYSLISKQSNKVSVLSRGIGGY